RAAMEIRTRQAQWTVRAFSHESTDQFSQRLIIRSMVMKIVIALLLALSMNVVAWAQSGTEQLAAQPPALTPAELAIWQSPGFQKEFTESYVAETDIEPKVTADERVQMEKVMGLISSDKMNDAIALLTKSRNPAASAVFDFTLANIYFQQEKLDQAAEIY